MKLLKIDDAGFGFPLGGTMVGASIGDKAEENEFGIIDTRFFQPPLFDQKAYLDESARVGFELIEKLGITKNDCDVEVCQGFVNKKIAESLDQSGWNVTTGRIEGFLQDKIEELFSDYIRSLTGRKENYYYDPKGMAKQEIGKKYYAAVNWGVKNNRKLLKTGWGALKAYR